MSDPSRPEPPPSAPHAEGTPPSSPAVPPASVQSWLLLAIVLVGMLAGAIAVASFRSSGPDFAVAARAGSPSTASAAARDASTRSAGAPTPTWSGGVHRSRGRNVAVYELAANDDVQMWGKVVRPVLTVRCVAGTTEVFVLTQSAAALEGTDGTHTVQVAYDGEAEASERWLASADYDALFAENGLGAVRRIAAARTMRFGFTPYNAPPVVARFEVAGFKSVADKLSQTCHWK